MELGEGERSNIQKFIYLYFNHAWDLNFTCTSFLVIRNRPEPQSVCRIAGNLLIDDLGKE